MTVGPIVPIVRTTVNFAGMTVGGHSVDRSSGMNIPKSGTDVTVGSTPEKEKTIGETDENT